MRTRIVTAVLLAGCGWAQNFPKANGFVNDFANQLPLQTVETLENRVREYERETGNQIGVAVVPSLNGMSIDDYSQGLFRAWGVGQYRINNGVLFVWAPKERQIRIHVGLGAQDKLTNSEASRIVQQVRALFHENKFEEGVNTAVDQIMAVLGPPRAARSDGNVPPAPPGQPQDSDVGATVLKVVGVTGALIVGSWILLRRRRAGKWREEIPRQLAEDDASVNDADSKRLDAQKALDELRHEAPESVWQRCDAALSDTLATLPRLHNELAEIRALPQDGYGELTVVHQRLRGWRNRMDEAVACLNNIRYTLDTFRTRRHESRVLLSEIPEKLMHAEGSWTANEGLLRAAGETYARALEESKQPMPNWLLVYDLLADVSACLAQIENPTRARYQPVRYWDGDFDSAAFAALELNHATQAQSDWSSGDSSSSSFDSGISSDSGGSFGGGDSGGGGSSSDY